MQKEKNPIAYTFNNLKANAKKRNKEFDLTLPQFREFVLSTGYMEGKGKTALSLSIDRIDVAKGYTLNNLQVLTLRDNTIKRNEYDYPF